MMVLSKPLFLAALLSILAVPATAQRNVAGVFDYYVLALTWSPSWCELEGEDRGAQQCRNGSGATFTLHGLWPQYENGWPSNCRTTERDPPRSMTGSMVDIMGSSGSAWHQWKKHGRCSGLSARDFYDLAREAYASITVPPVLTKIDQDMVVPADVIEAAFLESNPDYKAHMVTVTCKSGFISEVRICLSKALVPRSCTGSVAKDCRIERASLPAIR